MASLIEPLNANVPITNSDGTPTPLLQRLLQKLQLNSGSGLTVTGGKLAIAAIPTKTLLANPSGATAIPASATLSQVLDFLGSTQGSILYRNSTGWQILAPGTSGQFLKTQGAGANPVWAAAGGGGGGTQPTIRASAIYSYNASSFNVPIPTGTVVGDLVVVFWENGYNGITGYPTQSGWNNIMAVNNGYTNGATAAKIMTSSDLSTGYVTVTAGGSFNGVAAIVTIVGTTVSSFVGHNEFGSSGSASFSSGPIGYSSGLSNTNLILCFIASRGTMTITTTSGLTALQPALNATNASGLLTKYTGTLGIFGLQETANFPASNNGYLWSIVSFQ